MAAVGRLPTVGNMTSRSFESFSRTYERSYKRLGLIKTPPPLPDTSVVMELPDTYHRSKINRSTFHHLWHDYLRDYGLPADPVRVLQMMSLLDGVEHLRDGDMIELGVQRGYTARLIYELMPKRGCTLYLLDTYERNFNSGDLQDEINIYGSAIAQNFPDTSPEGVMKLVTGGWPTERVKTVAGWFPDSYAGLEDKKWRFVHIDFDLYRPIRAALDLLWPNVVEGGVVLVHDYGCYGYPGVKKAVDEFGIKVGLRPVVLVDSMQSAVFVKTATQRSVAEPAESS